MSEEGFHLSAPMKLIIRLLLNILAVYLLSTFVDQIFFLQGGLPAYIIIGSLVTLMNVIVRPLLHVITLPLKLFMGIIVLITTNGLILWATEAISEAMDPEIVLFRIDGGLGSWLLAAFVLGIINWIMKEALK